VTILQTITRTAADGCRLVATLSRAHDERGVVILVHGLGDHGGRLAHIGAALVEARFSVLTPDMRGSGRSDGQRGYAPSYDQLIDELDEWVAWTKGLGAGAVVLYGQSMGANLAARVALRRADGDLAGLVLSSPLLRLARRPPRWKLVVGQFARRLSPRLSMHTGIVSDQLTADPELVAQVRADPLRHRRITPPVFFGMVESGEYILAHASQLTLPMLIMHGQLDSIASLEAGQELAERTAPHSRWVYWPGARHELHNDCDRAAVIATVIDWLESIVPMPAADRQ